MDLGVTLGYETNTGVVRKYRDERKGVFRRWFGTPKQLEGTVEGWDIVDPSRSVGGYTQGSAHDVAKDSVAHKTSKVLRQFLNSRFQGQDLVNLRKLGDNAHDPVGKSLRDAQAVKLVNQIERTNDLARALALRDALSVTVDGITVTVSFSMSGTHKYTVGTTWSTTTTQIGDDVEQAKFLVKKDSGYALKYALFNNTVAKLVAKNQNITTTLSGSQSAEQLIREGRLVNVYGLTWEQVDDGYLNAAGTFVPYVPDNTVIYLPDPADTGWCHEAEGVEMVPDGNDNLKPVRGMFSYMDIEKNPSALVMFVGDNRLPVLDIPNAIIVQTVVK